jgi:hypothetical protein
MPAREKDGAGGAALAERTTVRSGRYGLFDTTTVTVPDTPSL